MTSDSTCRPPTHRHGGGPEDHRRGARPQDGRPLGPRGGARPLLRGRRGELHPDPPAAQAQPRDRRDPPRHLEGRARSAALLNSANFIARLRREARYQQIVASGQYRGPLIAAEGDSWFQYPIRLKDVIDWTFETYAIYCRSEAGDTLENMLRRAEYLDALDRTGGRILLLSGGGNDLVAGGNLAQHLRPFDPRLQPAQYLLPSFGGVLDAAIANIEQIVRSAGRAFPACRVICHGYDYAIPNGGNWLGRPMAVARHHRPEAAEGDRPRDGRPAEHPDDQPRQPDPAHRLRRLPRRRRRQPLVRRAAPDRRGLRPRDQEARREDRRAHRRHPRGAGNLRLDHRRRQPARAAPRQVPDAARGRARQGLLAARRPQRRRPPALRGLGRPARRLRVRRRRHGEPRRDPRLRVRRC